MNDFFQLAQRGTSAGIEIRAGLTTFMVMAYIIFVNPIMPVPVQSPTPATPTPTAPAAPEKKK